MEQTEPIEQPTPRPQSNPETLPPDIARRRAFRIGLVCIVSYLASYISRNLLSLYTPEMSESSLYTLVFLGYLSSAYMFAYAGGQLVNGILGDYINPIALATGGFVLSGVSCLIFPFMKAQALQMLCFILLGYGLSMLRGPMVKVFSENTKKNHARMISTFLTVVAYIGPWVASAMSFLGWRGVFTATGVFSLVMAVLYCGSMLLMKKLGHITIRSGRGGGVRGFFKVFRMKNFFVYFFVGGVVQTASSSFGFWLTTYLVQDLNYSKEAAQYIYSTVFLLLAAVPFLTLFLFRITKERQFGVMRVAFFLSVVVFVLMILPIAPLAKVICFAAGEILIAIPSSLLWSIYIPGLGKSGKVSSINGIMDCSGYLFAALTNIVLSALMDSVLQDLANPWRVVILIWAGIAAFGFLVSLFGREGE